MKYFIICISLMFILEGCNVNDPDLQNVADLSSLNGNSFVMEVDRISEFPDVQFPMDNLEETNYVVYNGGKTYNVSFSEDGHIVTLEPDTFVGEKIVNGAESIVYELTNGLFAGGRFVVWFNDGKYTAELTVFGSGIPILLSERGNLLPKI